MNLLSLALKALTLLMANASHAADCEVKPSVMWVAGDSMRELFKPEDRIEVQEGWYACHEVRRADIAVVQIPGRKRPIVKIVQVLPGDSFELKEGDDGISTLLVNGKTLVTPLGIEYKFSGKPVKMLGLYAESFSEKMPPDTYFVFGTSPHGSFDSTRFGPLRRDALVGRVVRP
ncbi:MAG: signal peptidase I [Bdellovibrionales bacterium]|nr:signal peptidase I [Bdellovibrionales bacterium]